MTSKEPSLRAVTLTLNPALDRTLSISGFRAGAVNRVEREQCTAGGKGVNVASALADYGVRVAATGLLGRDNCAPFEALFRERRIADHFVRIPGSTRTGIKIIDPLSRDTTDINFSGLAPSAAELGMLFDELETLDAPIFTLSGSVPSGVPEAIYATLVTRLRARDRKVFVDTSGTPLARALEAHPYALKPNQHELEALLGRPLTSTDAVLESAHALCNKGVELVVVSLGSAGAVFVRGGQAVRAVPPEINVESTVGAGDALLAGLVVAELQGSSLVETARLATAFSVAKLERAGPRRTTQSAVESALGRVRIA